MLRRRRAGSGNTQATDAEGEDAEFPDLPGFLNDVLYSLGTVSLDLRRRWKTGTSLLMVATVRP